jgi:hypothetical protein
MLAKVVKFTLEKNPDCQGTKKNCQEKHLNSMRMNILLRTIV